VHAVVLFLNIIQMLGVLVDSERAEHMLEEKESVVVLMLNAWGIVEHTDVRVIHFVITDEHEGGYVDVLVSVGAGGGSSFANTLESVVNLADELLVINVTSSDDN